MVGGGSATAAKLITGKNIKDGSIASQDLSSGVRAQLAKAGKAGKDGADGRDGAQGAQGAQGVKGDTGAQGAKGDAGTKGDKGDKGDTGAQGQAGDPGVKGDKGDPGTAGANGAKGDKGDTGAAGADGAKGDTGAAGADGAKGDKGDQGPQGSSGALPPGFDLTNPSVKLTSAGVRFGPYADGGAAGGSLYYDALNGAKLSDIASLSFRARFSTGDDNAVAVPYLRIFLEGDTHDVIYSPNTQPALDVAEDVFHTWDARAGTVRYDDDPGDNPDSTWADVLADHGDDAISGIYVTIGFTGGTNLTGMLSDFAVNGDSFHFGQG